MTHVTNFIASMREFTIASIAFRLILATLLSALMGSERGRRGRAAGLRTHILVCVGATLASMTGIYIVQELEMSGDASRIAAQVISGIGFLGAGTILVRNGSTITGLTTAACVWATGAIGLAIGYGFYEAAIIATIITYLTIKLLSNVEHKQNQFAKEFNLYVEFLDASKLNDTIFLFKEHKYLVESIGLTPTKTNLPNAIAANITVKVSRKENVQDILEKVNKIENVNFAIINYSIIT